MRAIAIVGAAGRFPGAPSLDALWERILSRASASAPVPIGRWPVDPDALLDGEGRPDRLISTRGCYLDFLPEGDSEPSHLLAAEVGREAWADAGMEDFDRSRVSAVLANIVLPTEGSSRRTREVLGKAFEGWALGRSPSFDLAPAAAALPVYGAAEALSDALSLGGGAYTLDAACASSLFALHLACMELEAGRADAALAGGLSLPHSLYTQVGFTQLKALSPSGACLPFDRRADGLVVGEGAGIFVLQRLEDAVAQGRRVLGVIRGIGLSNDVGGSLLSPEREGQLRAMRAAYADAGWSPADVDLVECHGTGTPRGDEVEISSLEALFEGAGPCVVGSVKSNVGHLLTGAGAAGLAKVLLAMREGVLPPTAGISGETSLPSLAAAGLTILEEAVPWQRKGDGPRRAAVSGFGFGGTNAHVLVEEWLPPGAPAPRRRRAPEPIAIVGMSARFGTLEDLAALRAAIFSGTPAHGDRPPSRWPVEVEGLDSLLGAWIESLRVPLGRFKIPPKEIPTLLPQHLLALEAAIAAVEDAGLPRKGRHLRAGAVMGLELDLEATSFHLRWLLRDEVRRWASEAGASVSDDELETWTNELLGHLGAPLDASRTLGALGGVVASRIARELVLGGPTLTVSGGACSGLRAIESACRLLQRGDVDWMIAGAVDLAGDLRKVLEKRDIWGSSLPFDGGSEGALPGEGAAALVLKRLEDARRDGDRIHAVIHGIGAAFGEDARLRSLERAWAEAGRDPREATLVEAHGSGVPEEDREEARALHRFFPGGGPRIALGSAKRLVGHAGAAAGIASVVKAALCISDRFLPPHPDLSAPTEGIPWSEGPFYFPRAAEPWLTDEGEDRLAGVDAREGALAMHLVLGDEPRREQPRRAAGRKTGKLAFVFPGTGNHFLGMGRLFAHFPEIRDIWPGARLRSQLMQPLLSPWRSSFGEGWEAEALRGLEDSPEKAMLAQVAFGVAAHHLLESLGVRPDAVIGYSLGESTSLLATGVWPERDEMFARTLASPLFREQVFGSYEVARRAWGEETSTWSAAIVRRGNEEVLRSLRGTAELLIVNGPDECIVGGKRDDVLATSLALGVDCLFLPGIPSVHCSLAKEVEREYRELHDQPTSPRGDIRVYSGAFGKAYEPTRESTVESILLGATEGFDFTRVIEAAYEDGIRIFLEVGPQASCTRMIRRILGDRPHLALSISHKDKAPLASLREALEALAAEGVEVDLDALPSEKRAISTPASPAVEVEVGRRLSHRGPPPPWKRPRAMQDRRSHPTPAPTAEGALSAARSLGELAMQVAETARSTAASHAAFLEASSRTLALQHAALEQRKAILGRLPPSATEPETPEAPTPPTSFDRDLCMEFALGSLAKVLGPAFAEVDSFPTRVRLPDEPLMLVDRILHVEGTLGRLGPGSCVTEHDVLPGQWYLDGGRAPVCISVESGQADLFLCAYLGIDLVTRGERVYRLLDAKVVFHRDLPLPGETIRYDIRVKKFIQQGTTHLLFFEFDGTIGGAPFITMRDGCAGFFSKMQLESGRGIVGELPSQRPQRRRNAKGEETAPFAPLVPMQRETLDEEAVEALRRGDLEAAFGSLFHGIRLPASLRLPAGRMRLVDRIVELDPEGGRYGLGRIVGEADIDPEAWFLTCHFVDDMVMPGTLMYECCLHTLRVFLLRMGWVVDEGDSGGDLHYAPVVGAQSQLKCRGQVRQTTRKVRYRIDLKEIGYDPEPYALADASMIIDGVHAVEMEGMSLRLAGIDGEAIESFWRERRAPAEQALPAGEDEAGRPVYDRRHILAFSSGSPVAAFGAPYRKFETGRRMARLPAPPFSFIDEIVPTAGRQWELEPGAAAEALYRVSPDAWYFGASRQGTMPYAVLLEVALQPCGWLAAWLGSALHGGEEDLFFRNLEGSALVHQPIEAGAGDLRTTVRLEAVSPAGGMILQAFRFRVESAAGLHFSGSTRFGFFPEAALRQQAGIPGASLASFEPLGGFALERQQPLHPLDPPTPWSGRSLPAGAWLMLDRVDSLSVEENPHVHGSKTVRPDEWFFDAHFPGDPVMPGSLGIEAFLQLLRIWAGERWPERASTHRISSAAPGPEHHWTYRGQVLPRAGGVEVQAKIVHVSEDPLPTVRADGLLAVDGKVIYSMKDFTVTWSPNPGEPA